MTISEAQRFEMHRALKKSLGDAVADSLMEHLPPSGWDDVARTRDIDLLDRRISSLENSFTELRSEFGGLRSDFHRMSVEINNRLDSFTRFATMIAIAYGTLNLGVVTALAFAR